MDKWEAFEASLGIWVYLSPEEIDLVRAWSRKIGADVPTAIKLTLWESIPEEFKATRKLAKAVDEAHMEFEED